MSKALFSDTLQLTLFSSFSRVRDGRESILNMKRQSGLAGLKGGVRRTLEQVADVWRSPTRKGECGRRAE